MKVKMSEGFISIENQVGLIDSIVKSTNKLIPLIERHRPINEAVNVTVKQIFLFLSKIIKLLPDLLVAGDENKHYKSELNSSFQKVMDSWKQFEENPEEFITEWEEFSFWWEEFSRMIEKMKINSTTIYLSMN
jgi:hypothetical protein